MVKNTSYLKNAADNCPFIVCQQYNLQSFLLGQVYRQYLLSVCKEEFVDRSLTTSTNIGALFKNITKVPENDINSLSYRDLVVIEPYESISNILPALDIFPNVYFVSRLQTHLSEYLDIQHNLPETFTYIRVTEPYLFTAGLNTITPIVDITRLDVLRFLSTISDNSDYVAINKNLLITSTGDHRHFASLIYDSDFPLTLSKNSSEDGVAAISTALNSILNKCFMHKKKSFNILYIPTYELSHYDYLSVIDYAKGSNSPLENIDAVATFTYYKNMVQYRVKKINENIDLIELFAKHDPQGDDSLVYIHKHGDYYLKPIVL